MLFEGRWYSSGELFQVVVPDRGRADAARHRRGDRVVVTMANGPEVQVLYQAVWRAGDVVTPAKDLIIRGGFNVYQVHLVDTIPLTAVGKIDRKALRPQLVEAGADAR